MIVANVWAGSSHVSCTGGLQLSSPELQELLLLCGLIRSSSASCTFSSASRTFSRCSTSLLTTVPVSWLASVAFSLSLDSTARCNVSICGANADVWSFRLRVSAVPFLCRTTRLFPRLQCFHFFFLTSSLYFSISDFS